MIFEILQIRKQTEEILHFPQRNLNQQRYPQLRMWRKKNRALKIGINISFHLGRRTK